MKCSSKVQATKIAEAGTRKMTAEKYSVKASGFRSLRGVSWTIVNRESGARYAVSIDPANTFCSCPFFAENREFGICKHTEKAREEADWEASVVAREEMYAL